MNHKYIPNIRKDINCSYNGSITIFLALVLTLIISVIISTIESARRIAVSSYLEGVTQISMDSVFSDYCTQLWKDYHIFAVISNNDDFKSNLNKYISNNLDVNNNILNSGGSFFKSSIQDITINEFCNLTDNYGEYFIDQILSYLQYKEISNIADYFLVKSDVEYDPSNLGDFAKGELSEASFEALDFGPLIDMVKSSNETLVDENYESDVQLSDTFSLDSLKSVGHIFNEMLIYYLVPSPSDISYKSVTRKGLPSLYMENYVDLGTRKYNSMDKFLFCEYLTDNFSSYTTPIKSFSIDYQLEYILCGYISDEDNLIEAAREMILLRFGFNVAHILSDKEKMNTVASIAETTAIIPALPIIIETLLISLWALSESVIDVRDLLGGKTIPLLKSKDDWTLSIENMLNFDYDTESKADTTSGLTYNNYLEMLLYRKNIYILSSKALDLIQMDFTYNINNTFSIVNCIIGASCSIEYTSSDVFSSTNLYHKTYLTPTYTITHNYYYR